MYIETKRIDVFCENCFCGHPRGEHYQYGYQFCTVRKGRVENKQEPCENYVGGCMEEIRSKVKASNKLDYYTPERDNPYPLCIGGKETCNDCCLFADYEKFHSPHAER
jgi:hypothetical protein